MSYHAIYGIVIRFFFSLIGPIGIGLIVKYQSEYGRRILQKLTMPFVIVVQLFNMTVSVPKWVPVEFQLDFYDSIILWICKRPILVILFIS